jgi:hypothetical protein
MHLAPESHLLSIYSDGKLAFSFGMYRERERRFLEVTKTPKMIQWVLVSMYGLQGSISEQDVFTSAFDMQVLFE